MKINLLSTQSPLLLLLSLCLISYASSRLIVQQAYWNLALTDVYTSSSSVRSAFRDIKYGTLVLPKPAQVALGIYSILVEGGPPSIELKPEIFTDDVHIDIEVGDGCKVKEMGVSMMISDDPNVLIVTYDFEADLEGFSNTELTVEIPTDLTGFDLTNSKVFVAFNTIKFGTNAGNSLEAKGELVTDNIKITITKSPDTDISALKASIIVVSNDARSALGFSSETFSYVPEGNKNDPATLEKSIGQRTGYKIRPYLFLSLSKFEYETDMAWTTSYEMGVKNNLPNLQVFMQKLDANLNFIYDALLFCPNGDTCFTDQTPSIAMGRVKLDISSFLTGNTSSGTRSLLVNSMLPMYMSSTVKYKALGVSHIGMIKGFRAEIETYNESSITINITAVNRVNVFSIEVYYLLSAWDGFQAYYQDFTPANPSSVAIGSPVTKSFYIEYDRSINTNGITADVVFSEFEIPTAQSSTQWNIDSEVTVLTSNNTINCSLSFTLDTDLVIGRLAGFVLIFNSETNDFMLDSASIEIDTWESDHVNLEWTIDRSYFVQPMQFLGFSSLNFAESNTYIKTYETPHINFRPGCESEVKIEYYLEGNPSEDSFVKLRYIAGYPTKTGIYHPTEYYLRGVDDEGNICLQGDPSNNAQYVIVLADESTYGGAYKFSKELDHVARIFYVAPFLETPLSNLRSIQLPAVAISIDRNLTYHIQRLIKSEDEVWNLEGFKSNFYDSFPREDTDTDSAVGTISRSGSLPESTESYETVVATRIYTYTAEYSAFMCQINVTFSGVITGLYVNAQYILAGSSVALDSTITIASSLRALFLQNQWALVTIVGTRLEVDSLSIGNCQNEGNIDVEFVPYYTPTSADEQAVLQLLNTTTNCPSDCISCLNDNLCYECNEGYVYDQSTNLCAALCMSQDIPIVSKSRYCDGAARSMAFRNSFAFDAETSSLTVEHTIQPYNDLNNILTIFYPYQNSYSNYPVNFPNDDGTGSFADPVYHIESSSANTSTLSSVETKLDIQVDGTTPSLVRVIAYDAIQDKYLLAVTSLPVGMPARLLVLADNNNDDENSLASEVHFLDGFEDKGEPYLDVTDYGAFEVHFFLQCDSCTISITVDGFGEFTLDIFKNENLQLANIVTQPKDNEELDHEFTGLSYIIVRGNDCSKFGLQVTGEYTVYAPKSFLFEDELSVCAGGKVSDGTSCVCPPGTIINTETELCVAVETTPEQPTDTKPEEEEEEEKEDKKNLTGVWVTFGIVLPLAGCCGGIYAGRKRIFKFFKKKPEQPEFGNDMSVNDKLTPNQDYNNFSNINDQSILNQNASMAAGQSAMQFKPDEDILDTEMGNNAPQNASNTKSIDYYNPDANLDDVDDFGAENNSRAINSSNKGKTINVDNGEPNPTFGDFEAIDDGNNSKMINNGGEAKTMQFENIGENNADFNELDDFNDGNNSRVINSGGGKKSMQFESIKNDSAITKSINVENSNPGFDELDNANDAASTSEIGLVIKDSTLTKSLANSK